VDDDMVGRVTAIKYSDHDVTDVTNFPDLSLQVYLESRGAGSSCMPLIDTMQWILGLYNIGIMNLLDAPHFGRGKSINSYVKKLLEHIHGRILWIDRLVLVTVDLIARIIGLTIDG
jgi:hypothetical protein